MDAFAQLMQGFAVALTPMNLVWCLVGTTLGTAIGVLPGLGPALTIALLLPITFKVDPTAAFILFAGIYYGAMYGGSTTSILLNTPGESATIVTALGYGLAGEVVVTGRAKDLIIINGRNVWPQDIEWAVEAKKVVKNGDAAAFSIDTPDGERVVVAVLARVSGDEARANLARDVAGAVREAVAVDCDVALVAPTMGLPTTSSGKLSRARTKANYLAGLYAPKPAAA